MKKYLSLLLLCAAVCFSSCEKHDYAEDMVGYYSFEESGTLSIGGQQLPYEDSGKFAVSRKAHNQIVLPAILSGKDSSVRTDRGSLSAMIPAILP